MKPRLLSIFCLAIGISSLPVRAQSLSVGVKAGIPLNDAFTDSNNGSPFSPTAITNRYIIGPQVELRLPFHLGVEADALYRHFVVNGDGASQWEFPILLKYHFKGVPLVHPFVDAGPIFNHVSDIRLATPNQSTAGLALGGGLDFHALIFHLTPEVRYVRWGSQNYNLGSLNSSLASNQNQVEFLVGFTF